MRRLIIWFTASALTFGLATPPTSAHNAEVHQAMTDYAYEVMRAGGLYSQSSLPDEADRFRQLFQSMVDRRPELRPFLEDMARALPKLQTMPSGLADENPKPCDVPGAIWLQPADWQLPAGRSLNAQPMSQLRFAVTTSYDRENVWCGIDPGWAPINVLSLVNPLPAGGHRDHTGMTLGYWASAPDYELGDWRMRSTTIAALQNPIVVGGAGAGAAGLASAACFIACGFMPILCPLCPMVGGAAGAAVVDSIINLDAEAMEHPDFTGLAHHIDVKTGSATVSLFDDRRGKWAFQAGPSGVPDILEELIIALFDDMGWHVNYDASLAPKNYEIVVGQSGGMGTDGHRNSTRRTQAVWEAPTLIHHQLSPVDNLGMFGWLAFRPAPNTERAARSLGWPLHALGDATSPMHAVGATGYGHRPYEDAAAMRYPELFADPYPDFSLSLSFVATVVERAFEWRKFIVQWRLQRNSPRDVPVRDLVTAVAESTLKKANATPQVWNESASLAYFVGFEDQAKAAFDTPALVSLQRDTVLDGIAVTLAFLVSAAEVVP